jgi:hypothetical protein
MSLFKSKPLSCAEFVDHATGYLEGTLSKREHKRLASHLGHCGPCSTYLAQMRQTLDITHNIKPEPVPEHVKEDLARVFNEWRAAH